MDDDCTSKREKKSDDLRMSQLGAPKEADYARPAGLQSKRGRKLVQRNMYDRKSGSR